MKKIPLIILSCCFVYMANGQGIPSSGKYQNDLATDHFKGNIKSIESFFYEKPNTGTTEWSEKNYVVYNKQGNIVSNALFNNHTKNTTNLTFISTYDEQGRAISIADPSGKVMSRSVYNYNAKHKLVESISSSTNISMRIVYNEEGKRDTLYITDVTGRQYSTTVYIYNKAQNTTETDWYREGSLQNRQVDKYDTKGNKIEEIHLDPDNKRTGKMTYQYDGNGNMIMKADSAIIYIRGTGGNSVTNGDETVSLYKYYGFDKAGNWLQKDELVNDIVVSRVKRKIEYYP